MAEIAAVAGLMTLTGAFIATGVAVGTHYIDKALRVDEAATKGGPLVRRSRPSGADWQTDAA